MTEPSPQHEAVATLPAKREPPSVPSRVKNEPNLRRLPVFPLQKGRSKRFQSKDGLLIRVERPRNQDGSPSLTVWEVTGSLQPSDKAVFMAVESFMTEHYLSKGREVPEWVPIPSYRLLLRHEGKTTPGISQFNDLKDSLRRIKRTALHSEGAWRSKRIDEQTGQTVDEWVSGDFGLYDEVWIRGETRADGKIVLRGAVIALGRTYRKSLNSNHVIPLDYDLWLALKNPVARRLLEILSGKFYGMHKGGGKNLAQDYITDVCDLLPLEPQRHLSDAKRSLRRAHAELVRHAYLASEPAWEWTPQTKRITYTPGPRARGRRALPAQHRAPALQVEQGSPLAVELERRGVAPDVAARLVRDYDEQRIRRQLDMHDHELRQRSDIANPGGRLAARIRDDWPAVAGYQTPDDRAAAAARQKAADEQRAAEREAEQRAARWWEYETPEEHAQHELAGFWLLSWKRHRNDFKAEPTDQEQAAALVELTARFTAEASEKQGIATADPKPAEPEAQGSPQRDDLDPPSIPAPPESSAP